MVQVLLPSVSSVVEVQVLLQQPLPLHLAGGQALVQPITAAQQRRTFKRTFGISAKESKLAWNYKYFITKEIFFGNNPTILSHLVASILCMLCSKSVVLRLGINRSPTPLFFL